MARREDTRTSADSFAKADLRGPEARGPEAPPAVPGRAPAVERRPFEDPRDAQRSALRDPTRTKARRKATVAQRAARDHAGNQARLLRSRPQDQGIERRSGAARPSLPQAARYRALDAARALAPRRLANRSRPSQDDLRSIGRDRPRQLSVAAAGALEDIGRFRVVREEALQLFRAPQGEEGTYREEIAKLKARGLVEAVRPSHGPEAYLVLTGKGRALAQKLVEPGQRVYAGVKKPRELRHDAAVYDAYQLARRDLEATGHRVRFVRLDYEMKQDLRRKAWDNAYEKAKGEGRNLKALPKDDQLTRIKAEAVSIAKDCDLPVDDEGSVEYPDLQIEYDRPDGDVARCNVEVVTESYKASQIEAKQAAGFQCFSIDLPRNSGGGGAPRAPMRSLVEELLSF